MSGNCAGGVTSVIVTSDGGYGVLAGNWLLLGYNPGGTPGICPSELPRNREGTRANGWTDDCQQDSHLLVSLEDRDIYVKFKIGTQLATPEMILYEISQ